MADGGVVRDDPREMFWNAVMAACLTWLTGWLITLVTAGSGIGGFAVYVSTAALYVLVIVGVALLAVRLAGRLLR